jgi:hypothetical protein
MRNLRMMAPAVLTLLATAACDEGVATGPEGQNAATEVRLHGDAPSGANESRAASTSSSSEIEGSLDVRARVFVWSEAGEWVELTRGSSEQTVEASGEDGFKLLARSEVEAGSYSRVRVEFERVSGELSGSLFLGLGGGSASLALETGGDGKVVVEREVRFEADAGATTHLDVDLNAPAWVEGSGEAGVVAESAFASAVEIAAR